MCSHDLVGTHVPANLCHHPCVVRTDWGLLRSQQKLSFSSSWVCHRENCWLYQPSKADSEPLLEVCAQGCSALGGCKLTVQCCSHLASSSIQSCCAGLAAGLCLV